MLYRSARKDRRVAVSEMIANIFIIGGPFVAVLWTGIYLEKRLMQRLARKL